MPILLKLGLITWQGIFCMFRYLLKTMKLEMVVSMAALTINLILVTISGLLLS